MKKLRKLFIASAALVMVSATATQAATVTIHLAGSTAYRSAVHNAIARILTAPQAAYIGSSLAGASAAVFQGTIGSDTVIFETAWNGSITGIKAITAPTTNKFNFLLPTNTLSAVTVSGQSNFYSPYGVAAGAGGGNALSGSVTTNNFENVSAELAFSDLFQSTAGQADVVAKSPVIAGNHQGVVGVLPFAFLKGAANTGDADYSTWQHVVDITSNNILALYSTGQSSAQLVTNNPADINVPLAATGRDIDSGTRGSAFAETGFGAGTAPTQLTILGTTFGPQGTVTGSSFSSTGESSGGTLSNKIATPGFDANVGGYPIAYIGAADTDTTITEGYEITVGVTGGVNHYTAASLSAVGGGTVAVGQSVYLDVPGGTLIGTITSLVGNTVTLSANIAAGTHAILVDTAPAGYVRPAFLTFNGVALTKANIQSGKYQFWEYEHYYFGTLSTAQNTYVTSLVNDLTSTDANVAGYFLSDLTNNGQTVFKNFEGQAINLQ